MPGMSNTLLGLGLAAIMAGIVGGGLKAFGVEFPLIQSTRRQQTLAALGVLLIAISQWDTLRPLVWPTKLVTSSSVASIDSGGTHPIALMLAESGPVEVILDSLQSRWEGFTGPRNQPGHDALHVTICGGRGDSSCATQQMAVGQAFSKDLPAGHGLVSLFNFASNPPVQVALTIKHP
jgi:hypothetical protein